MSAEPPFRADQAGSLLRPERLKAARAGFEAGKVTAAELKQIEDAEIRSIVEMQEKIGFCAVTDGEFRRAFWHYDFLVGLDGVDYVEVEPVKFKGAQLKPVQPAVVGKIGASVHPMVEHFTFLKNNTKAMAKMTIPAPSTLHFRNGRAGISSAIYPSMDDFFADLGDAYRKVVNQFVAAGCRYLQLDEVFLAYLCDPSIRSMLQERGDSAEDLAKIYIDLINTAVADVPDTVCTAIHLCRGNFRSSHVASGGYEWIAEKLFNDINIRGYFLEFDNERSGGFEPLRFVPNDKIVVLGLVTSKDAQLEDKNVVRRRIEEASRFVPLDQLCLSPQCGFASTEEGNSLTPDEQWAKLRLVVDVASEVWSRNL